MELPTWSIGGEACSVDQHKLVVQALAASGFVLGAEAPLLRVRRGKSLVKQHQLVNKILATDIATWHGLTLELKAPPS